MTLTVENLEVRYGTRSALRDLTLELAAGQLVAMIGPNGAGKSSLLKAVAGLIPSSGNVGWHNRPLQSLGTRERASTISYLPQGAVSHWPLPARELVALGRLPHTSFGSGVTDTDAHAVATAMRRADIEALAERRVDELSGGERARVHLARALAVGAPVLLVDEPVASLDPYHQLGIMSVLQAYAAEGALVVAVMHDIGLAARFAARLVFLEDGRVVAAGSPERVLDSASIRRHYRVEPYLGRHEGQLVVAPWRRV
jgi:iron complex transport system ATP-binding protein